MSTLAARLIRRKDTEHGWYWKSAASKATLRDHLIDQKLGGFKQASIGGEQESGFEQAFSSLAYAYLKDKAPRLLDFMVGFQLVDRNEDNTKAMGIFGFHVGDQWLYAPVFFLNGDLKGHELLYLKNSDTFVPMKENWVNYLISRKPHELGEGSELDHRELGGLSPTLIRLIRPPYQTAAKYGEDRQPPRTFRWAEGFLPFLGAAAADPAKVMAKHAGLYERLDLGRFLAAGFGLLKTGLKLYKTYPLIKQGFDRFYGPDFFARLARGHLDEH